VTAIARLGKGQRAGEASITTLWRYDDSSTPDQPRWNQVEEKENISWT
jgi:hypothetical protein